MVDDQARGKEQHKDFFISYTGTDRRWAEWIAWHLEEAGYSTTLQAWDFHAGGNFVLEMDKATRQTERTIAVLSPDYFAARFTSSEWTAAFYRDPRGEQGILLPIRVRSCDVEGLLGPIGYIDLVDRSEQEALMILLANVQRQRRKPMQAPVFPSTPKPDRFPGTLPPIWNVPYPRNFYFTGREDLLQRLATSLRAGRASALSQPQAMSGLGGIGKTQIALEYTYRYYQDYQTVLWAQAATRENLTSSYLTIAALLNLPEKGAQESARVITAVKLWLQRNADWLLILDNADDLVLARDFLPPSSGGHVLITTRAYATGHLVRRVEVDILPTEQGSLFLLRRAGLLAADAALPQASERECDLARALCEELGGLPLALDQAGAYIEETGCSLSEYQQLYQCRHADLLAERGGQLVDDHPLPVAATWKLSFEQVEQKNTAAADLLRLCAFLAPDAIPEAIITAGAEHLGPTLAPVVADPYQLTQAIKVLRAYSLIRRETSSDTVHLLSVHRLVQAVLRDSMEASAGKRWKQWAVLVVSAASPNVQDVEQWDTCERWLSHALMCVKWIEQEKVVSGAAGNLTSVAGYYLYERARYEEAEPMWQHALTISNQLLGPKHPYTAHSLNNLAELYQDQGKYTEAELLLVQALSIYEQQLGPEHPSTARSLNNLAELYRIQGKDEQAESLYQRALTIRMQRLGPEHPSIAISLGVVKEKRYQFDDSLGQIV